MRFLRDFVRLSIVYFFGVRFDPASGGHMLTDFFVQNFLMDKLELAFVWKMKEDIASF